MKFLDDLITSSSETPPTFSFDPQGPEIRLTLTRYVAGLARSPKLEPEFTIRVQSNTDIKPTNAYFSDHDRFDYWTVEKFLDEGPERSLLIGLPGAGKTYALRRAAARAAERLHDASLAETFNHREIVIPIFADLKLYRGSLDALINETLPPSLSLADLVQHFKVRIFIDSFKCHVNTGRVAVTNLISRPLSAT